MEGLREEPWSPIPKTEGWYPKTKIAYFRIPWAQLEPNEGEYRIDILDKLIEKADRLGEHLMIRLTPHSARPEMDLPDWFMKKLGLAPREIGNKLSPNDPLYYEKFGKMIEKLCRRLDGEDRITSVDMSLVSAWGEGAQIDTVQEKSWQGLVDAYMKNLKITPVSAQFNSPETVNYATEKYRPIGFRADCLGNMNAHMFNHYPHIFPEMKDAWLGGPIQFESCWVIRHWLDMGWDIDYIIEQSVKWHITSLNAKSVAIPEVWRGKIEDWIKKMGYRFAPRRLDYPSSASPGDRLHTVLWIENRGCAPIYHSYDLVFRLRSENEYYDFKAECDIKKWMPGDNIVDVEIDLPENIREGKYRIEAGIVKGKERIFLAADSERCDGFNVISGEINIKNQKN